MNASFFLEEWLTWAFSPATSAIFITLLISLLLPILIHFWLYRKSSKAELSTFLLLGPSGSGKTSLQTLLAHGSPVSTHTSQASQAALCTLPDDLDTREDRYRSENDTSTRVRPKLMIVDTPGHGKLRPYALSALTSGPAWKGVVFVIDSAAVGAASGLADAADYLYDVLLLLQKRSVETKSKKTEGSVPFLILANKQDIFSSLPPETIRQRLETEIARIRQRKANDIMDSGVSADGVLDTDDEHDWLGQYRQDLFTFAELESYGTSVQLFGGAVKQGHDDHQHLHQVWLTWFAEHL